MSNSLDPDQDRRLVCPDLGPYCLQMLSVDNKKLLLARKKLNICSGKVLDVTLTDKDLHFSIYTMNPYQ